MYIRIAKLIAFLSLILIFGCSQSNKKNMEVLTPKENMKLEMRIKAAEEMIGVFQGVQETINLALKITTEPKEKFTSTLMGEYKAAISSVDTMIKDFEKYKNKEISDVQRKKITRLKDKYQRIKNESNKLF